MSVPFNETHDMLLLSFENDCGQPGNRASAESRPVLGGTFLTPLIAAASRQLARSAHFGNRQLAEQVVPDSCYSYVSSGVTRWPNFNAKICRKITNPSRSFRPGRRFAGAAGRFGKKEQKTP
jgi:hypothetical protein